MKRSPTARLTNRLPSPQRVARAARTANVATPAISRLDEPASQRSGSALVVVSLLVLALLLFAGAAVSPGLIPWPRLAVGLHVHRGDLVVMGFGTAGIALTLFCVHRVAL